MSEGCCARAGVEVVREGDGGGEEEKRSSIVVVVVGWRGDGDGKSGSAGSEGGRSADGSSGEWKANGVGGVSRSMAC